MVTIKKWTPRGSRGGIGVGWSILDYPTSKSSPKIYISRMLNFWKNHPSSGGTGATWFPSIIPLKFAAVTSQKLWIFFGNNFNNGGTGVENDGGLFLLHYLISRSRNQTPKQSYKYSKKIGEKMAPPPEGLVAVGEIMGADLLSIFLDRGITSPIYISIIVHFKFNYCIEKYLNQTVARTYMTSKWCLSWWSETGVYREIIFCER